MVLLCDWAIFGQQLLVSVIRQNGRMKKRELSFRGVPPTFLPTMVDVKKYGAEFEHMCEIEFCTINSFIIY
jgi:hypothetical protein